MPAINIGPSCLPWQLGLAYVLDLLAGDPRWWPHPIRWIGLLIGRVEWIFYDADDSPALQRLAGCVFAVVVVVVVACATLVALDASVFIHHVFGSVVAVWLAYATLSIRSLHQESRHVMRALHIGDLESARKRLSMIVSRDTDSLDEQGVMRAVLETVAENTSDAIVAPLFFLGLGGPLAAMTYKAVNTMDSMVGYTSQRYLYFGWFAARLDDLLNWIPARLSGLLMVVASACLRLDWRNAFRIMWRDGPNSGSPNAGYPEAAAAGALQVQLGGASVYFSRTVAKPTLGDPLKSLTFDTYRIMIRIMYVTSALALAAAVGARYLILIY